MSNLTNFDLTIVHRHEAGKHSKNCLEYNFNYKGWRCKYSWEPFQDLTAIKSIENPQRFRLLRNNLQALV